MSDHHVNCIMNPITHEKCNCGAEDEFMSKKKVIKPISPDNVVKAKKASLPDEVIESFNELIAKNWNGSYSEFKQDDVIDLILGKMDWPKESRHDLFENNWLDVEPIYEAQGWKVDYDKPGYNEDYSATFNFSKDKKRQLNG
jgi:hypothetical protein